jgi:hypothetical protein
VKRKNPLNPNVKRIDPMSPRFFDTPLFAAGRFMDREGARRMERKRLMRGH